MRARTLVVAAGLVSASVIVPAAAGAGHTDAPTSDTIAGSLQDELGCPRRLGSLLRRHRAGLRRRRRRLAGDLHRSRGILGVQGRGYWNVLVQNTDGPVNFIIHRGDEKDPGPDQSFDPATQASAWIQSGDVTVYDDRGGAEGEPYATIHYRRPAGDYGDYSGDYTQFWGLHTWDAAEDPGWTTPRTPDGEDLFGVVFQVPLIAGEDRLGYLLHRGDEKDPGPDQFLDFDDDGYEVWQLQGADPAFPYVLPVPT